jgi:hypothetical protein
MTQDEIIEMAREAGWKDLRDFDLEMNEEIFMGRSADLLAFAKLVAAKEREACAKVCDDIHDKHEAKDVFSSYAEAIRARGQA